MIEFDTALLGAYYTSGASFSASTQRLMAESALARGRGPAVIPPWELPSPAPAENRAVALLSDTSIIDLDNPRLDRKGVDDTFKRLFALYNGLTKMAELADFAASDRSADSMRQVLDRKFQGQM